MAAYNTVYQGEDPWYREAVKRGLQKVIVTGQELLPTREFRHTGFYQDVMVPSDSYDNLSITLEEAGEDNAGIIIYRSKCQPFFGQREKDLLGVLVPHLRRMVRLRRQFEQQHLVHALNTRALDLLAFGVVLLDQEGHVRYANRAADGLLTSGDGLGLAQGRLLTWSQACGKRLSHAIADALGKAGGTQARAGGDLCIRRRSGKLAYVVQVLPVVMEADELSVLVPGGDARGAVVIVTDPERQMRPADALLRQMFGLTATEAELAAAIGAGDTIREIAEARGISEGTARWHIKNVQAKTGARRMSELTGIVGRISGRVDRG